MRTAASGQRRAAQRAADERVVRFVDACAWAELHRIDGERELVELLEAELARLLGARPRELHIDVASAGRTLEPHETCLPLLYGETEIGHLIVQGPLDAALALRIEGLLLHAATALVQRRLRRAEKQALDAYCACVEAMHEGVGLFQEADSEIASARFLELCASAVKASAGAVLLREEFGNIESRLCIESLLGVPENFLEQLADRSGRWWPATVQGSGLVHLSRPGPGHELPVLDPACVPPALLDVVACPLEYQLFPVGLLLLFNLEIADDERRAKLSGLQSLGNLGAVVFHRQAIDRGRS